MKHFALILALCGVTSVLSGSPARAESADSQAVPLAYDSESSEYKFHLSLTARHFAIDGDVLNIDENIVCRNSPYPSTGTPPVTCRGMHYPCMLPDGVWGCCGGQ